MKIKSYKRFYESLLKVYKARNPKVKRLPDKLVLYFYEHYHQLKLAQYRRKRFQKYLAKAINTILETMTKEEILIALQETNPKIDVEHAKDREDWELAEMLIFNLLATNQPIF